MGKLLMAALVTASAGASLWGWGRTATRAARSRELPVMLTVALGLAVLVFLGGILNLLHLARALALDVVAIAGLGLAGFHAGKSGPLQLTPPSRETLLTLLPLLLAGWFLGSHLLPQSAYNVHDDLEKYFAHPVKMLANGTFGSNPLNSLGAEAMGGQAFLQSFVAAHLPLTYLGAFDAFFCALLCVALAGFAVPARRWAVGAILAQVALLAINPQVVNIAAVFSAVALTMTAMLLAAHPDAERPEPSAPLLGLVYAGLVVLKTTLILFVGVHFVVLAASGLLLRRHRARWMLQVPLWTLLFLSPWLALHAPLYLAHPPLVPIPGSGTADAFNFWSANPLGYDTTALHYTAIAAGALGVGLAILVLLRGRFLPVSAPLFAAATAGLSAGAVYFSMTAGFGPLFSGADAALRYTCPILIAAVPVLLRLTESVGEIPRFRLAPAILNGLAAALVIAFVPAAGIRVLQIARLDTPLAYLPHASVAAREKFFAYNQDVLNPSGPVRAKLAAIQALVPAGEPLGAWVMTPYWLDFKRNPVLPTDPAGLSMRWSRRPADVRYFLYEHAGFAVRPMTNYQKQLVSNIPVDRLFGSRTLAFLAQLQADTAQVLYNDGSYVLLELRATAARQE